MELSIQTKNAYSEIYNLLKIMNKQEVMQIPTNILETIKKCRNSDYEPEILSNDSKIILSKKAISIYLFLYINYMEKDEKNKQKVIDALRKNEENKAIKYKIDIFEKDEQAVIQEQDLVEYKPNIFQKIIVWIKKIFKH